MDAWRIDYCEVTHPWRDRRQTTDRLASCVGVATPRCVEAGKSYIDQSSFRGAATGPGNCVASGPKPNQPLIAGGRLLRSLPCRATRMNPSRGRSAHRIFAGRHSSQKIPLQQTDRGVDLLMQGFSVGVHAGRIGKRSATASRSCPPDQAPWPASQSDHPTGSLRPPCGSPAIGVPLDPQQPPQDGPAPNCKPNPEHRPRPLCYPHTC